MPSPAGLGTRTASQPRSAAPAVRLAIVQHGDYREAMRIYDSGEPEPYFSMKYSVEILEKLVAGREHLMINLDAPGYDLAHGIGSIVGVPRPQPPSFIPARFVMRWWGRLIVQRLKAFRPTHLLLRTPGELGYYVLSWCVKHNVRVMGLFANRFRNDDSRLGWFDRQLAQLVNHPLVAFAGNHRHVATKTLVDAGAAAEKAVPYEWAGVRRPEHHAVKDHKPGDPVRLVFAGNMITAKGLTDVIDAVAILRGEGMDVRLTAAGVGADFQALHRHAMEKIPNHISMPGSLGNDEVFRLMREATLVCVPTWPEFAESGPMTLTEGLAARTPAIITEHPVFLSQFVDGEGVRFYPPKQPAALAAVIRKAVTDGSYRKLSVTTQEAFLRTDCKTIAGELLERWAESFTEAHVPAGGAKS